MRELYVLIGRESTAPSQRAPRQALEVERSGTRHLITEFSSRALALQRCASRKLAVPPSLASMPTTLLTIHSVSTFCCARCCPMPIGCIDYLHAPLVLSLSVAHHCPSESGGPICTVSTGSHRDQARSTVHGPRTASAEAADEAVLALDSRLCGSTRISRGIVSPAFHLNGSSNLPTRSNPFIACALPQVTSTMTPPRAGS